MNHTTTEFEIELLAMGVDITEFRKPHGYVSEVFGKINDLNYKWNCFGHCYRNGIVVPEYNINFKNSIQISDDQKTILHGEKTHKFHRTIFLSNKACTKCSLLDLCISVKEVDFPFPCHRDIRTDKHNGYFVRKNTIFS